MFYFSSSAVYVDMSKVYIQQFYKNKIRLPFFFQLIVTIFFQCDTYHFQCCLYTKVTNPEGPDTGTWSMHTVGWLELGDEKRARKSFGMMRRNINEPFKVASKQHVYFQLETEIAAMFQNINLERVNKSVLISKLCYLIF